MENCVENARILKECIVSTGRFNIVSKDIGVPLVAFKLNDSSQHTVFEISENLRRFGWIVPAYTMPRDAEHVTVLRVVIREDFSRSLAERLVSDLNKVLSELDTLPSRIAKVTSVAADAAAATTAALPKKSAKEMQEEITSYWKRLVEKKTSGVC